MPKTVAGPLQMLSKYVLNAWIIASFFLNRQASQGERLKKILHFYHMFYYPDMFSIKPQGTKIALNEIKFNVYYLYYHYYYQQ